MRGADLVAASGTIRYGVSAVAVAHVSEEFAAENVVTIGGLREPVIDDGGAAAPNRDARTVGGIQGGIAEMGG